MFRGNAKCPEGMVILCYFPLSWLLKPCCSPSTPNQWQRLVSRAGMWETKIRGMVIWTIDDYRQLQDPPKAVNNHRCSRLLALQKTRFLENGMVLTQRRDEHDYMLSNQPPCDWPHWAAMVLRCGYHTWEILRIHSFDIDDQSAMVLWITGSVNPGLINP